MNEIWFSKKARMLLVMSLASMGNVQDSIGQPGDGMESRGMTQDVPKK